MRTILESIRTSLESNRINEGQFSNVVITWDPSDPADIKVFTNVNDNDIRWYKRRYWGLTSLRNPTNLIMLKHDDESGSIKSVGNTESDMKSRAIKDITRALKIAKRYEYGPDDTILIETPLVGGVDIEYNDQLTPDGVYKTIIDHIKNSYIDGDSADAVCIIDIANRKVLYGDGMECTFWDNFAEYRAELESER